MAAALVDDDDDVDDDRLREEDVGDCCGGEISGRVGYAEESVVVV
jgi:hypothetical protein